MKSPKKKLSLTTGWLILILLILFLVSLGIAYYFVNRGPLPNDSEGKIRIEIIKSLLEFLVVIIIGGTVAALFKVHERNQEQAKIRIQMKLDFIKRIGELYRIVKSSRRLLRFKEIRISSVNDAPKELTQEQREFYVKQMLLLNDVQLEIEAYKIAWENSFLFEKRELIVKYLERMEKYLNKIISQFEEHGHFMVMGEQIDYKNFSYLWEFTAKSDNEFLKEDKKNDYILLESDNKQAVYYCFKKLFSKSYGNILTNLR